ncbi:DNA double-strand break repair nuclease NurA [Oligella urethralis]|uniref:NurA domain-containing protein n=1 Tax=Oligella urethralis DNF00040 TaxID=1401065 RepID=A0A095YW89_9BURK|nr:DNA double-strand break repair nuclease NurA [Oligella urethralis]KGF26648.1 NurA domain-containing protein [Oligella urethralis DNF00040]
MSYSSFGAKPYERASKSSHHHIINDPSVKEALNKLYIPPRVEGVGIEDLLVKHKPLQASIQHIVAIDGGYTEVPLRDSYPSAKLHFFQFGALHFKLEDLEALSLTKHIDPEDMQKLKNIDRIKLPLGTYGTRRQDCASLCDSVRKTLFEFLAKETLGEEDSLLETLAWFTFKKYKNNSNEGSWVLASNPHGRDYGNFELREKEMNNDYSFRCSTTGKDIYLSDIFRLHELISEDAGAGGIVGYVAGLVEHLLLLHVIRHLIKKNPGALKYVLFIIDRPTGWFGVTARMHSLMLELNEWLFDKYSFFLAGLEKSGAFVEHAADLQRSMPNSSILLLNDKYIYSYISPGQENPNSPYASTSYYGHKVIFKTAHGQMYVVSLPVKKLSKNPKEEDIPNLHSVLGCIEKLHCDMYENALLPVALANKLVSLSAHPSSNILRTFSKDIITSR